MQRDREALSQFLTIVEGRIINPLVEEGWRFGIPEEFLPMLHAAWNEARGSITRCRDWLGSVSADPGATVDQALEQVGLTGMQLQLKLAGFRRALDRLASNVHNSIVKWYKEVLSWANLLLDSLTRAYPPLEPAKEFKEFLELSIDFSGNAAQHR